MDVKLGKTLINSWNSYYLVKMQHLVEGGKIYSMIGFSDFVCKIDYELDIYRAFLRLKCWGP